MYYCEVLVSSQRYHGTRPLTYSSENLVAPGDFVTAPLGSQLVVGIVVATVPKPKFATKPIKPIDIQSRLPVQLLQLHSWMQDYYPAPLGLITQLFVPSNLATTARSKQADTSTPKDIGVLPPLRPEQEAALSSIGNTAGSFLLHGDTGSGKTRIYIERAMQTLRTGRSVVILTPEIGLTPQLSRSLETTFPGDVLVTHSTQTVAQRRNIWKSILEANRPLIVIGPRSAIFAPLQNIGLIVVDEAHDASYKQDQMPYYQTTRVAAQLAKLHNAQYILGSATPLVHDYFAFSEKKLPIIRMKTSAAGESSVQTKIVDLSDRQQFSRSPWLSNELISSIAAAISNGHQGLLFLNRRGSARIVLCQNCAWQATCSRCDLPLTYHGDLHKLQCHTCGFTDRTPVTCPDCKKPEIQFKSIGTKTLVSEVSRLFPDAAVLRFDSDNSKSESLEANYQKLLSGEIDIIVGTQMLSKGLDLPLLAVIGVIVADTSLYFPDYSAEERTYQMLGQVMGRVGRGHIPGTVVLQTYHPKSETIQSAIDKNYEAFYSSQVQERNLYRFPPYYFVLKVSIERSIQSNARKAAHDLSATILSERLSIELIGPAPSFVEKVNNKYQWQIVIKSKRRSELLSVIKNLPKNCRYDIDPTNLL